MGSLIRYLMAFAVQMAWQRAGRGGATPPMRMPFGKNKNRSMPLPIIGPWQMMIAMWLGRQVWTIYGNQVKNKLQNADHPVVNHIGNLLPDTPGAPGAPGPVGSTVNAAPATPAASPVAPPAPSVRQAPQYDTRVLDSSDNGSGNLPAGSLLSSLRQKWS